MTEHSAPPPSSPIKAIQMIDREQLRASLKPGMSKVTFDNWLARMIAKHGFPAPLRLGARRCSWRVAEIEAWLGTRPRMGTFDGRRSGGTASA